ncbi:T9SS type A sorting domain-containing protein [Paraflavisolibacter sp. H34]|uniref:T9SS type A sorting domain-containing protein n=1 Tax=Huijunlia imazamoxiresistens TaxID=3127457 RepID=UPI0030178B05
MRKLYLFLIIFLCNHLLLQAQNATCYTFNSTGGVSLENMTTGTSTIFGTGIDDEASSLLSLPFSFSFAGNSYNQFSVSSNGLLGLGATPVSKQRNVPLKSLSTFPVIAPYLADLNTGTQGNVRYKITGTAGSRKLVVEWNLVSYFDKDALYPHNMTFQAWLFEGSNLVQLVYGNNTYDLNSYAGIGIAAAGTDVLSVNATDHSATANPSAGNGSAWPGTGRAYLFSAPSGQAAAVSISAPGTSVCAGTPVTFTATPTNGGTAPVYQWKKNGNNIPGEQAATYTTSDLANGDKITCQLTSNATCLSSATATSNSVKMTVSPLPSVQATASPATLCSGGTSQLHALVQAERVTNTYSLSSVSYAPVGISGTAVALDDDAVSASLPIGFNFAFFGTTYSEFSISSNGNIQFGAPSGGFTPQAIPGTSQPNNFIALCWADLDPSAGGSISYQTTGTAPNRKLVVRYSNIPFSGAPGTLSGQIVLSESTHIIELFLASQSNNTVTKVAGIENTSGTAGYALVGKNNTNWTATAEGWRFSPSDFSGFSYSWTPAASLSDAQVASPVASPSVNTNYMVTVTDANGCFSTASVQVALQGSVTPSLSISAHPSTTIVPGTTVTFTALAGNEGSNPSYQWSKNGSIIPSANGATYSTSLLADGDRIECLMVSNAPCATPASVSAQVQMKVADQIVLPLTLLRFGTAVTDHQVQLNWLTAEEKNVDHFEVERSTNSRNFIRIHSQAARGKGAVQTAYAAVDNEPAAGTNYYRLKMVDKDSSFKYSEVKSVNFRAKGIQVTAYPNPFEQSVQLNIRAEKATLAHISVTDFLGRRILQQTVSLTAGSNQVALPVSAWQAGLYQVQVIAGDQVTTSKLVKQ